MNRIYTNRTEAGRLLAAAARARSSGPAMVLGLPRGGVPVAVPVARALGASVDLLGVRKVGVPGRPELAMGAVADGVTIRNEEVVATVPGAARVVAAVPVASREALEMLKAGADEVICMPAPSFVSAVGQCYEDFSQLGDEEVRDLLAGLCSGRAYSVRAWVLGRLDVA